MLSKESQLGHFIAQAFIAQSGVHRADMAENPMVCQGNRASIHKPQQKYLRKYIQVQQGLKPLWRCPVELEGEIEVTETESRWELLITTMVEGF